MATVELAESVAELTRRRPEWIAALERLRIDYCCHGQLPLGRACEERGLDPEEVLRELQRVAAPSGENRLEEEWNAMPLDALADHVVQTHHEYLREELPALSSLFEKVAGAHASRRPELLEAHSVYRGFRDELALHMLKEEQILFPWVRRLSDAERGEAGFACGSIVNPIHVMEREHESAGRAIERMRRLTDDWSPPEDACASYRSLLERLGRLERDLHLHVHKENNILFPRAVQAEQSRSR